MWYREGCKFIYPAEKYKAPCQGIFKCYQALGLICLQGNSAQPAMPLRQYMRSMSQATMPNADFAKVQFTSQHAPCPRARATQGTFYWECVTRRVQDLIRLLTPFLSQLNTQVRSSLAEVYDMNHG